MALEHDFKKHPELKNSQMDYFYFMSPHKQIFEDFEAKVIKVTDGDTIRIETNFRDFNFPLRLLDIAAPELNEEGGRESQKWLEEQILNEEVNIEVDPKNRVGKWGRLLGRIIFKGSNMGEESRNRGHSIDFNMRTINEGIPKFKWGSGIPNGN
jgi:endonuclease YncB( thermonuclease family)